MGNAIAVANDYNEDVPEISRVKILAVLKLLDHATSEQLRKTLIVMMKYGFDPEMKSDWSKTPNTRQEKIEIADALYKIYVYEWLQ